jgi:hypothetical protein
MYPKSHNMNHRYRGPMESYKLKNFNDFLHADLSKINKILSELEERLETVNTETVNSEKYDLLISLKIL